MLTNYIPASYRDIFGSYKKSYIEVGRDGNHKIVTNRKSLAVLICGMASFISQGIMIVAIHYMFNRNASGYKSMQNVKSLFNMSLFILISSLSRFLFVRWLTGLSDYVGRTAVLLLENLLLTISAIVGIGSSDSISLLILSAFWGILDLYYPVGKALLNDINTFSTQRTKAFSLYCGNVAIGFGLGLVIGVIMTTNFGLDSSCILVMVLNVCSIFLLVATATTDTSTEWIIEKNDQSPYLRNWTCLDLVPLQDIEEMWQQGSNRQQSSSSQPTLFCRTNISSGTFSARFKTFLLTYAPWEGGLIANHCTTPLLWLNEALAMAGMKMVLTIYSGIMRITLSDSFISFTLLLVAMGIGMIFIPSMILQFIKEPGIVFIGVLLSALGCLFLCVSGSDLVGELDWPEFVGIVLVAVGTCWLPASCSLITAMYPVNRQGEIQGVIAQIDILASLTAVSVSLLLDSMLMYDSPVYWHGAPYLLAFLFYLSSATVLLAIYRNKICERQDRTSPEPPPAAAINPLAFFQNKDSLEFAQEPYLRSLALSPLSPTSPRSRSSSVAREEPHSAKCGSKDVASDLPRSGHLMLGNCPPVATSTSAATNSYYFQENNDIDASPDANTYNSFEFKRT